MGWFSNNNKDSKDNEDNEEFKDKVEQRAQEIADDREDARREWRERREKRKNNEAVDNIIKLKQLFPVLDSGYGLYSYWSNISTIPTGLYIALNYLEYQSKNTVGFKEFCSLGKPIHVLYNLQNDNIYWESVIKKVKNSSEYFSYKTKLSICKDKDSFNTNTELVSDILKDHLVLADLGLFDEIKDGTIAKLTKEDFLISVYSAMNNLLMAGIKLVKPDKITKLYGLLIFEGKDFDFEQVKSKLVEQCYNNISNNISNNNSKNNKCDNSCCNCKQ